MDVALLLLRMSRIGQNYLADNDSDTLQCPRTHERPLPDASYATSWLLALGNSRNLLSLLGTWAEMSFLVVHRYAGSPVI